MKRITFVICVVVGLGTTASALTVDDLFIVLDPRSNLGVGLTHDWTAPPYVGGHLLRVPEKTGLLATVDDITAATEDLVSQEDVTLAVQDKLLTPTVACANDGQGLGGSCSNVCTKSVVAQIVDNHQCQVATGAESSCTASAPSGGVALCCICAP